MQRKDAGLGRRLAAVIVGIALALLSPAAPAARQGWSLCASDASRLESLARFRTALATAVGNRDVAAIRLLMATDVSVADGEGGFENLVEVYELDDPASVYWVEFEAALSHAGVLDSRGQSCVQLPAEHGDDDPGMFVRIAQRDGRWVIVRFGDR